MKKAWLIVSLLLAFVLGSLVQAANGNWVLVVQGQQMLYVKNPSGQTLFSTPVITGRSSLQTLPGTYHIQRLSSDKWFAPETTCISYNSNGGCTRWRTFYYHSEFWAPISSAGVGIHDANWWYQMVEFDQRYAQHIFRTGQGSHGCINVPPSKMRQLRSYLYVGMKVVVRGSRTSPSL